ncbi:MAG TPA: HhH-GPD-type base excision DNA repair protein [Pseudonocardiaceae bacterium]
MTKLCLTQNPEADALLDRDPLALLIGMLLDQQVAMEVAFIGPKKLVDRLGKLDVHQIAEYDPAEFAKIAATPPAVHRFPGSMAKRIQAVCQFLVEHYDGQVETLWTRDDPTGPQVLSRLKALPGFGDQKARIFLALLGKQRGITPKGWRAAAGPYGDPGAHRSIADVVDPTSLTKVREFKKAAKQATKQKQEA